MKKVCAICHPGKIPSPDLTEKDNSLLKSDLDVKSEDALLQKNIEEMTGYFLKELEGDMILPNFGGIFDFLKPDSSLSKEELDLKIKQIEETLRNIFNNNIIRDGKELSTIIKYGVDSNEELKPLPIRLSQITIPELNPLNWFSIPWLGDKLDD